MGTHKCVSGDTLRETLKPSNLKRLVLIFKISTNFITNKFQNVFPKYTVGGSRKYSFKILFKYMLKQLKQSYRNVQQGNTTITFYLLFHKTEITCIFVGQHIYKLT